MTMRIIVACHGDINEEQNARNIGLVLSEVELIPNAVFALEDEKSKATANVIIKTMELKTPIIVENNFTPIDYKEDEDKPENEVKLKLGTIEAKKEGLEIASLSMEELFAKGDKVLEKWNTKGTLPSSWSLDIDKTISSWLEFAEKVSTDFVDQNILLVMGDDLIRFAPYLTQDFVGFTKENSLEVKNGNFCIFEKAKNSNRWICRAWNENPETVLQEIYDEEYGCGCGDNCGCEHHHDETQGCCGGHHSHEHSEEHPCSCGKHKH
ncbi:MAG: hypothetical protein PHE89_00870 [Alphaproteobacteria bacterium]|nr:hypothetical protein [Alphaproteobacteria bacterium]